MDPSNDELTAHHHLTTWYLHLFVLEMLSDVSRRQNSSCDSCRRSKRRCIVPDTAGSKKACEYCTNLGRTCTFRSVAAYKMKKRRASTNASPSGTTSDGVQAHAMENNIVGFDLLPIGLSLVHPYDVLPMPNLDSTFTTGSTTECDNQLVDLLPPELADLSHIFSAWSQHSRPPLPIYDSSTVLRAHSETHPKMTFPSSSPNNFASNRASPSRPIDLMSTTFGVDELGGDLVNVYDTVFGRCASRFLSYRNNIFSGSSTYFFRHENRQSPSKSGLIITIESPMWSDSTTNDLMSELAANPEVGATSITLIGITRFLDSFGGLFGNPLTKSEQMSQERTLAMVCRAFALQWLPLSSACNGIASMERFAFAWREAHDCLTKLKYTISFRRIFAVLLFQMTSHPPEATFDSQDQASPHVLLNCALQELQHLAVRVRKYCTELLPNSRYRKLIDISLSAIQWWAYLRDTSTSISTDRRCILPYPPCRDSEIPDSFDFSDNISSPIGLCEQGTGELFVFYRHVIRIRSVLEQSSTTTVEWHPRLTMALEKCTGALENTSVKYMRWLKNLESGYPRLSRESQASSSLLLIFWSLGVLAFVEELESVEERWIMASPGSLIKRDAYRSIAVSCMIRTAQVVEEARLHKISDENLKFRTDDPARCLIHASSEFVVAALVKGIHHTLAMNAAGQSVLDSTGLCSNDLTASLHTLSVAPLVALLSGMTETVSGSLSAAVALQKLVQKYGDALMDCCF
jgi:hypothetical protein